MYVVVVYDDDDKDDDDVCFFLCVCLKIRYTNFKT